MQAILNKITAFNVASENVLNGKNKNVHNDKSYADVYDNDREGNDRETRKVFTILLSLL